MQCYQLTNNVLVFPPKYIFVPPQRSQPTICRVVIYVHKALFGNLAPKSPNRLCNTFRHGLTYSKMSVIKFYIFFMYLAYILPQPTSPLIMIKKLSRTKSPILRKPTLYDFFCQVNVDYIFRSYQRKIALFNISYLSLNEIRGQQMKTSLVKILAYTNQQREGVLRAHHEVLWICMQVLTSIINKQSYLL